MVSAGNILGSIVTMRPLLVRSQFSLLYHSWKYSLTYVAQPLLCGPPSVILKTYEFGTRILFLGFVCSQGKQRFFLPVRNRILKKL
jgi:hypothetical protein